MSKVKGFYGAYCVRFFVKELVHCRKSNNYSERKFSSTLHDPSTPRAGTPSWSSHRFSRLIANNFLFFYCPFFLTCGFFRFPLGLDCSSQVDTAASARRPSTSSSQTACVAGGWCASRKDAGRASSARPRCRGTGRSLQPPIRRNGWRRLENCCLASTRSSSSRGSTRWPRNALPRVSSRPCSTRRSCLSTTGRGDEAVDHRCGSLASFFPLFLSSRP